MKRGGPLQRKTPLRARSNLKATKDLERRTPVAPMSKKRKAEIPKRAAVRAQVLDRDRSCRARGLLPGGCRSPFPDRAPLEVHEVIPRGRWRAGYLAPENCVALCQVHHDYATTHPDEATAVGLLASRTTGVDNSQGDE